MTDPTERFSTRVENYIAYRPSYPPEVVELLAARYGLRPGADVADVGSGTGILAQLLLAAGARVFGVEPNREMREAAERLLRDEVGFTSVDGTAEATTLPDGSVDLVTAAQAFHWFDPPAARAEFRRILRPGGFVVLIWNDRRVDTTPFLAGYEELLHRFSGDYAEVNHKQVDDAALRRFFGGDYDSASFENRQRFDYAGLQGRLLSSSYAPEAGDPRHAPMLAALRELFDAQQQDGAVSFDYDTRVFAGRLQ